MGAVGGRVATSPTRLAERVASVVNLGNDDPELACQLESALVAWPEWCHRRVESLELEEDGDAFRRISIDCTPRQIEYAGGEGQILVPLTMAAKALLCSFSLFDADGSSLPLLGREENSRYGALFLASLMRTLLGRDLTQLEHAQLLTVCVTDSAFVESIVTRLMTGLSSDLERCGQPTQARELLEFWLRTFSNNFLLLAVIDRPTKAGRIVVKFSYRREYEMPTKRSELLLAGIGVEPLNITFELPELQTTRSNHIEFHLPGDVECLDVTGLKGSVESPVRARPGTVVHVQVPYRAGITGITFSLRAEECAIRKYMRWGTLSSALFLFGVAATPNALGNYAANSDASTTLLLFGPALWLVLANMARENNVTRELMRPYRWAAWALAGILSAAAMSLVGGLMEHLIAPLWVVLAGLAAVLYICVNRTTLCVLVRLCRWFRLSRGRLLPRIRT